MYIIKKNILAVKIGNKEGNWIGEEEKKIIENKKYGDKGIKKREGYNTALEKKVKMKKIHEVKVAPEWNSRSLSSTLLCY